MDRGSRGLASDVGGQHRDRRRGYARNAKCLAKSVWPDLRKPLNDFFRETGNAVERKIRRDSPALFLASPRDIALLPSQVAGIFDFCFHRRDIDSRRAGSGVEFRQTSV